MVDSKTSWHVARAFMCCQIYILNKKVHQVVGAMRNATSLIQGWLSHKMLAITHSKNVYARTCIYSHVWLERDNNMKIAIYKMLRWWQVHLSPTFRGQEAKMSNGLQNRKRCIWITISKTVNRFRSVWTVNEKSWAKHEPILCDLLLTGSRDDVISYRNAKTIEGYVVINFEVASCSSFSDKKNFFVTAVADIDYSIRRKCFCVLLKKLFLFCSVCGVIYQASSYSTWFHYLFWVDNSEPVLGTSWWLTFRQNDFND